MDRAPRILIVGAGIGGLALAIALQRRGFPPERIDLIERTPAWKPVGAGIVLGVNAMALLGELGLGPALAARGQAMGLMTTTDAAGRPLQRMPSSGRFGPTIAVHRADLQAVLLEAAAPAAIRLGTTLAALTERGDGVEARFSDGSEGRYDLVIGADGLRSQVRTLVFGPQAPRYAGYASWRFVVPLPAELAQGEPEAIEMWGCGKRLGLVSIGQGRLYGYTTQNAPEGAPDPLEGRAARLKAMFAGFGGAAPAALAAIAHDEQVIHTDIEEIARDRWVQGRVALLGDAAHALTPNLGQGAAMAIEDACALAGALAESPGWEAAFAAYQARRIPRVGRIAERSRVIGQVGQWEHPWACALRDTLLRLVPAKLTASDLEALLAGELR